MSATKTGTPAFDSCPARSWSVFVLPVPVAPATSPCRFIIDIGTATRTSLKSSPSCIALPMISVGSSKRVAGGDRVAERLVHGSSKGGSTWSCAGDRKRIIGPPDGPGAGLPAAHRATATRPQQGSSAAKG